MEINRDLSLYVGNLHPDVDEELLNKKFSTLGQISNIYLCRNSTNDVSLGYAYVTYYSRADAEKALDTMNFKNLINRPIRVMWANSNSSLRKLGIGNIFIKNLHKTVTDEMLHDTFYAFGKILSSKVARDNNNRSKGYGFVHYSTEEEANKAIEMVNGMSLMGKIVFVGPFQNKEERLKELADKGFNNLFVKNQKKQSKNLNQSQDSNVYIGYLPKSVDEDYLRKIFQPFGTIVSAKVMVENGVSRGFGFVCFSTPQEAEKAITQMDKSYCGKSKLKVSLAVKKAARLENPSLKLKPHSFSTEPNISGFHEKVSTQSNRESVGKNKESVSRIDILQNQQKYRKNCDKIASGKQKKPACTAVEATSSSTTNHSVENQNLNGNISISMPTNEQSFSSRREKPQYSVGYVNDGQRDQRYYGRKPITLGSFITFMK